MFLLTPAASAPMLFKALLKLLNFASWRSLGRCLPLCSMGKPICFPYSFLSEHQGTHDVTKTERTVLSGIAVAHFRESRGGTNMIII